LKKDFHEVGQHANAALSAKREFMINWIPALAGMTKLKV
jgi:hypothetical protein